MFFDLLYLNFFYLEIKIISVEKMFWLLVIWIYYKFIYNILVRYFLNNMFYNMVNRLVGFLGVERNFECFLLFLKNWKVWVWWVI